MQKLLYPAALVAILLLAAGLRLWDLGLPQLWEDDYLSLDRASLDLGHMFEVQKYQGPADTIFDLSPPLSYALEHAALAISPTSGAARVPSLAAGLFTVLGFALLGGLLFSRGAGLAAALLCALSLFHIEFSRAIKFYALFLCFFVYSSAFLLLALKSGKTRFFAAYALAAAAMLYSGYQGVAAFAAQALYGAAFLFFGRGGRTPLPFGKMAWRLATALVAVLAAFSPFISGVLFINAFLHSPGVDITQGVSAQLFINAVKKFLYFVYEPSPLLLGLAILLAATGAAAFFAKGKKAGLAYLALVSGLPVLAVIISYTDLRRILSPRHMVGLYPALIILMGAGVDAVAGLVAGASRKGASPRRVLAGLTALCLCFAVAWPVLDNLTGYYAREMTQDREFFRWLSLRKNDVAGIDFTGYKRNVKRFAGDWHLPGLFEPAGAFSAPAYRRIYLVGYSTQAAPAPPGRGIPVSAFAMSIFKTRVDAVGLASQAPLAMAPGPDGVYRYDADFGNWSFYADAYQAENMTLDGELRMLRPARYSLPAEVVYAFVPPPGRPAGSVRIAATAALFKRHPTMPSDSVLEILAGPDGRSYAPAGVIAGADMEPGKEGVKEVEGPFFEEIPFYRGHRELERSFDLSRFAGPDGRLFVKIRIAHGDIEGFLNLGGLRLTASDFSGPPQEPSWALEFAANELIRNNDVHPWRPGAVIIGPGVFGFAHKGLPQGVSRDRLSPASDLPAFLAAHPGATPVYDLAAPDGTPALSLYDPGLAEPGLPLGPGSAQKEAILAGEAPMAVKSLRLSGAIYAPELAIGDARLTIPVAAPEGSVLTLDPGGRGRLAFTPDFTKKGFDPSQMASSLNMAAADHPDYDGALCCAPGTSCFFTYQFLSAYPIKTLRLRVLPRVYGARGETRNCRISISTDDGKTYEELAALTPDATEDWTPMFLSRYRTVRFKKTVTHLLLRVDMLADFQAQIWSPERPTDNMYLEAELDASSLPPLTLARNSFPVVLENPKGNRFNLVLGAAPIPFSDRIYPR